MGLTKESAETILKESGEEVASLRVALGS
jgi:hypothetical protein